MLRLAFARGCLVALLGAGGLACSDDERVLGSLCPGPYAEGATRAVDAGPNAVYGTSCAPCDGRVRYDARGCPIYESFASCGGDICVGALRLPEPDEDAGAAPDDDAGSAEEDAGDGD